MANKASNNPIPNLDTNWSLDPLTGLPYSGSSVQTFIKNNLKQAAGAAFFSQTNNTPTLYFFRTTEDRDTFADDTSRTDLILSTTVMNFSSEMYRVALTNNNGTTTIQAATNQTEVELSIDFDVQKKSISDTSWTSLGTGVIVHAYIDAGAFGNYTEIVGAGGHYNAGTTYTLNVRQNLITGDNRVKITFVDEDDENVTASIVYSISLSEMYIEMMNNTWYNAIVEGVEDNYKLGGFKIVGALSKKLKLEIYSGESMVTYFEKDLGTYSRTDIAYNYDASEGLNLSSLATGVFICKAYLISGSLESVPISYNFMHVTAADKASAQLVCANNVISTVYNYSDNDLCDYAIYNGQSVTGTPHVLIQLWSGTTPTTKVDDDYAGIETGKANTLKYNVQWLVEGTINLNLYFNITLGSSSQTATIPIDNSSTYPAETGAAFYMNATTRSNNDANKTYIVNEATTPTSSIQATWERMAWVNGIDGWTVDPNEKISQTDEGRPALLVPAGSKCTIPYQVMTSGNMTFEICYKVTNVSNYDENVITIATNPTTDGFHGIRIRPTGFTIHSASDNDASKDTTRGKALQDEEIVHLLITIQNSYKSEAGKNIVIAYVNGCKALEFPFDTGTIFENNANFIIGSSSADVYVYLCRVYRKGFGVTSAEQNYINSLRTLTERETAAAAIKSVINEGTHAISYDEIIKSTSTYNFFVVEMKNGATVPSRANHWSKDTAGFSTLEMHYGEHPEWDWKIGDEGQGVETAGQGTTSMNYYRWNIRWRIDKSTESKKVPIAYYDEPTIVNGKKVFHPQTASDAKTVVFDGTGNHPPVKRITAKINQASSMQSHKIGATRAYTALHNAIGLKNDAQKYAEDNNKPVPTVAVYQYPAFGFERKVTMGVETYTFIGLFTIGPDKGDKPTFGYDINDSIPESLITLEGTNHAPRLAVFQYPWNSEVEYRALNAGKKLECLCVIINNNDVDNAWEVSNCHGLDTDKTASQAAVQEVLEDEFKPAYDVVWNNSTFIFPVALNDPTYGDANAAAVLANINAAATTFRGTQYNDRLKNASLEFWIQGEYKLYHYDLVTSQYVYGGVNLADELDEMYSDGYSTYQSSDLSGKTLDEQNEIFKAARRARFLDTAPNYWDIQDAAYHMAFCIIFGATDNFAKNTYPYKMKTLANGGLWRWRQDDLDTIFDTDNLGKDSKPYYIEFLDGGNGDTVFGGANSIFWNLMYEVFWQDYGVNKGVESIGNDVVSAMATLGGGENPFVGVVNFFKKYFWDYAQNYFPVSAYNEDADFKYEQGWRDTNSEWNQPDALEQSLGRHLEAERLWCTRRALYVMSLFKSGPFRDYSDTALGRITFRPASYINPTVTPTQWMYPAIFFGEGSPQSTSRTEANSEHEFTGTYGDGNTNFYLQATNYLESLGDWKDLELGAGFISSVTIVGAKLKEFKIGEPHTYYTAEEIAAAQSGDDAYGKTTSDIKTEADVNTNIPSVSFTNTRCLEEIDARNAESLTGTLDLTVCTRLLRGYFEGTKITQVNLPNGSKIVKLHLSDYTNGVILRNLKFLTDFTMPTDPATVQTLRVENCTNQSAFGLLKSCFESTSAAIQYLRLIWTETSMATADEIHMFANIATNKDKDDQAVSHAGYRGITADGDTQNTPVINGTIKASAGMYMSDLSPLVVTSTEDVSGGLKKAHTSAIGALDIIYDPDKLYIDFADATVKSIALSHWGDGQGITTGDAANITSLSTYFKNQTAIQTFNELVYFTGMTSIYGSATVATGGAFQGCTGLTSVVLPDTVTSIGNYAFDGCSALTSINISNNDKITDIYGQAFRSTGLTGEIILTKATYVGDAAFQKSKISKITFAQGMTTLAGANSSSGGCLRSCSNLEYVDLPSSLTAINQYAMASCSKLTTLIVRATTPPSLYTSAIPSVSAMKIYVPYGYGDTYKAATNWSSFASKIYELDANGEIPE